MDKKSTRYLQEIFNEHYKNLCFFSFKFSQDFEVSKDIVQDVFLRLIENNDLGSITKLKNYLYTSVRNRTLDWLKSQKNKYAAENNFQTLIVGDNPEDDIIEIEKEAHIFKMIDQLPVGCKKVFEATVIDNLTYDQAAQKLRISKNTVKTQVKRAYRILREGFGHQNY